MRTNAPIPIAKTAAEVDLSCDVDSDGEVKNVTTEYLEQTRGSDGKQAPQMDEIKRTSGPQTTNGRRWEVQLSATPPVAWMDLFKVSGEASTRAVPQRVEFDRTSAYFRSDEDQVEHWVASIDRWIAATNAKYLMTLERVQRERTDRLDAETKEKERIQRLNDRFKDL